jgi:formamidopyrimidine-DNA glycosylase
MPELPEVETQVRDLQIVVGKTILDFSSDTPKALKSSLAVFRKKILGKKILAITRRAKYLVFQLSGRLTLVAHFRMTGHFLLAKSAVPLERFVRHQFKLSGGTWLQFSDIRKFGTLVLCDSASHEKVCGFVNLGPEPLGKSFTLKALKERLAGRRGKLKALLLNQSFIAGVGNIYADEICFGARLHPAFPVEKLKEADIKKLHTEIVKQLKKGVKNRGTTIGEYVDTRGEGGRNQLTLMAYQRYGEQCLVCGTTMQKMKISQRTTTYCFRCQSL